MTTKLAVTSVRVLDQEEALDFYVNKLPDGEGPGHQAGPLPLAHRTVPDDPDVEIFLEEPGPPVHDEATAEQLRDLITKGAMGSLVLHTDDARGLFETLQERGVTDFTQEPIEHGYGIDMGIRDPFGNAIRILQPARSRQRTMA